MQSPSDSVEQADERSFANPAFKKRVCGEGTEGVVANFGVSRGSSTPNELQISIGGEWRGIQ